MVRGGEHLHDRRELTLAVPDPGRGDPLIGLDQEGRGPGDVPGVDPHPMPHAIRFDDVAALVDEHVEREARVLDVAPYSVASLRQQPDDLDAERPEVLNVPGKLAKLAAAVGSPGSAVKHEKHAAVREQIGERPDMALLIRQRETWSDAQR